MINTIILKHHEKANVRLRHLITACCPKLQLKTSTYLPENYWTELQRIKPDLVFLEMEECFSFYLGLLAQLKHAPFEIIIVASRREYLFEAIQYKICGFLLKPLCTVSLLNSVEIAVNRITEKEIGERKVKFQQQEQLIGIPTMEGYEFIAIAEIIRCESYLKCTRVITRDRSAIISAYNIGEFAKALEKHSFFSPHQSHLINLQQVKRYLKEGTIIMEDDAVVPVARRRKQDFVNQVSCIVGRI